MRQLKVSPDLKDADLEKLIRNPNKWRLAKIKANLFKAKKLAPGLKAWGVLSASQKIGEALGDPTEGVATAIGVGAASKGINKIVKKKGKQWVFKKLLPAIGKTAAKKVSASIAAGTLGGPVGTAAGTILGTGLAVVDIYNLLKSFEEE